jgi:Arm domain-containing DNA-binding protein
VSKRWLQRRLGDAGGWSAHPQQGAQRQAGPGKIILLRDGGDLRLQVGAGKNGQINKSWIFRYAAAGTKISSTGREYRRERRMGLGPLPTVGLADAREMAREAPLRVARGIDPIEARHASKGAAALARINRQTFDEAAEACLQRVRGWLEGPDASFAMARHLARLRVTGARQARRPDDRYRASAQGSRTNLVDHPGNRVCAVGSRSCSTAPAATKGIRRDGTDTSSTGSQSATRAQREALAAMPYDEVAAFMGALRASYGRQIARAFDSGLEHLTERLNR